MNAIAELNGGRRPLTAFHDNTLAYPALPLPPGPRNLVPLTAIVRTEQPALRRVLLALATLGHEVTLLERESHSNIFPQLVLYGVRPATESRVTRHEPPIGEVQVAIARFLPHLQHMAYFVERVLATVHALIQQLAALSKPPSSGGIKKLGQLGGPLHHRSTIGTLARALSLLIRVDSILRNNAILQEHWVAFKRMFDDEQSDSTKAAVDVQLSPGDCVTMRNVIMRTDTLLFGGGGGSLAVFDLATRNAVDDQATRGVAVQESPQLADHIKIWLNKELAQISKNVYGLGKRMHGHALSLIAMVLFAKAYFAIDMDKKFIRALLDLGKASHSDRLFAIHIHGCVAWAPWTVVHRRLGLDGPPLKLDFVDDAMLLKSSLKSFDGSLEGLSQSYWERITVWSARMDCQLSATNTIKEMLSARMVLIEQGLSLAEDISTRLQVGLALHTDMHLPLRRELAVPIYRLIAAIKHVECTFERHLSNVSQVLPMISKHLGLSIFLIVDSVRSALQAKLRAGVRSKESIRLFDAVATLTALIDSVDGPATVARYTMANVLVDIAQHMKCLDDNECESIRETLYKRSRLTNVFERLRSASRCDALFNWNRALLPVFMSAVLSDAKDAKMFPYFLLALNDIMELCTDNGSHLAAPVAFAGSASTAIVADVQKTLVKPLCLAVEGELRAEAQRHQTNLSGAIDNNYGNPFFEAVLSEALSILLRFGPMSFADATLDLKAKVESYLNDGLYKAAASSTENWHFCFRMRQVALERFGLQLMNDHLPAESFDAAGLDFLVVMRKLGAFVVRYRYNLNQRVFIECVERNDTDDAVNPVQCINTFGVQHVAHAIQSYGMGVMKSAVDCAYQLLKRKLNTFSQFLHDDHIKSRLLRELRFVAERKEESAYPYDRAAEFNRNIRELGLSPNGQTYMDQFRRLLSQIGNTLAFVSLVRAGGARHDCNAALFVPLLDYDGERKLLARLANDGTYPSEIVGSAELVDDVIYEADTCASSTKDYLKLLIEAFAPTMRDPCNRHLDNFYMIVPALLVNHVDHMLAARDELAKHRGATIDAAFTDDGVAVAIVFLLGLLRQHVIFRSLKWFDTAKRYLAESSTQSSTSTSTSSNATVLTERSAAAMQLEYDRVYFAMEAFAMTLGEC